MGGRTAIVARGCASGTSDALRYHAAVTSPPARLRIVVALLAVALAACGRSIDRDPIAAGSTVLALGDSLTYGTGASPHSSYPAVLEELTGWRVENAGIPGETATQACERVADLLELHKPALLLVLVGGNDFLRRLPESGVREALAACHAHASSASVPMILLPVPRLGWGGVANAPLYAETAKALDVPLLDAGLADLLANPSMRADAVHLNGQGYRAMARNVADRLVELGWLAR